MYWIEFHTKLQSILRVPDQNGMSHLYNMLEIYHSGPEPFIFSCKMFFFTLLHLFSLQRKERERERERGRERGEREIDRQTDWKKQKERNWRGRSGDWADLASKRVEAFWWEKLRGNRSISLRLTLFASKVAVVITEAFTWCLKMSVNILFWATKNDRYCEVKRSFLVSFNHLGQDNYYGIALVEEKERDNFSK